MRHYDIPYVKNPGPSSVPQVKDIDELDLQTIIKYHLCGKSQGRISECMKCPAPCAYGKRAIELAFPAPSSTSSPKLINNKTILELAREAAAKQRKTAEEKDEKAIEAKAESSAENTRKKQQRIDDWYEHAYQSGDGLKWIMDNYNMTKNQAKRKVYDYQHKHPELRQKPLWESKSKKQTNTKDIAEKPGEVQENQNELAHAQVQADDSSSTLLPLENRINTLMNQQEEYKTKYEHYLTLYNETKKKVDALYEALSILNE